MSSLDERVPPLTALVVTGLEAHDLHEASRALREGRPVDLDLQGPVPRGLRLDELAPLLRRAHAKDPRLQAALDAFRAPEGRPESKDAPGPRVTAVIPTHRRVPLGLRALLEQDLPVRVLVLSNGPGGPHSIPGAEVLRVPWQGHGPTRRTAVAHVTDPYVFFTVDDAIPLGRGFLRTLIQELEAGAFEAVTARQVPWPDADPITREQLRAWTPPGHRSFAIGQVDHVATLHRRETLLEHPIPDVPIAEDAWWSRGRRVGYVPMAPILHSHPRNPRDLYRRTRDIHAELGRMGEVARVPDLGSLIGGLPGLIRPVLRAGPGELPNQLAELLGQWRGARRGRR